MVTNISINGQICLFIFNDWCKSTGHNEMKAFDYESINPEVSKKQG